MAASQEDSMCPMDSTGISPAMSKEVLAKKLVDLELAHAHSAKVSWEVRRAFRVKMFGISLVQTAVLLGSVVGVDYVLSEEVLGTPGFVAMLTSMIFAQASVALMWILRDTAWLMYTFLGLSMMLALVGWSTADAVFFADSAQIPGQVLLIMCVSLGVRAVACAILKQQHQDPRLVPLLGLVGWLVGCGVDAGVVYYMRGSVYDLMECAIPSSIALCSELIWLVTCSRAFGRCNYEDYQLILTTATSNLLLVITTSTLWIVTSLWVSDEYRAERAEFEKKAEKKAYQKHLQLQERAQGSGEAAATYGNAQETAASDAPAAGADARPSGSRPSGRRPSGRRPSESSSADVERRPSRLSVAAADWAAKFREGEAVPISVKKPFRIKAYTVAALQAWSLFAIVVVSDYAIESYDSSTAGFLVIILLSFAIAGMTMMWFIRKMWPFNVLAGIATSLALGAAWAIADAMDFWERANIPGQMLGIMGVSYLVHIVIFAAIWDLHANSCLFFVVGLLGWVIGVACCLGALYWMERALILAVIPAFMVGLSSMVTICTCDSALTHCGSREDDYMVVAVTTTANLLVFLAALFMFLLIVSGGYWGHVYFDVPVGTGRSSQRDSERDSQRSSQRPSRPEQQGTAAAYT